MSEYKPKPFTKEIAEQMRGRNIAQGNWD